jgi:hypothetical protein
MTVPAVSPVFFLCNSLLGMRSMEYMYPEKYGAKNLCLRSRVCTPGSSYSLSMQTLRAKKVIGLTAPVLYILLVPTHVQLVVLRIVQDLDELHDVGMVQLLHDGNLAVHLNIQILSDVIES